MSSLTAGPFRCRQARSYEAINLIQFIAAIFRVVLAFNLLGNTLRDVLDPRLRGR